MKKIISVCISLLIISACQKEIHFDFASEGSLAKDANDNCMPVTAAGIYNINISATDSNYLVVTVNVTAKGSYSIATDSMNGYSFKAAGVFKDTGSIAVKLACTGTPKIKETDHFSIFYNTSFCAADVTVGDAAPAAAFELKGSPGKCMDDSITGNYIETVSLDTSDYVFVSINVITPGVYTINTDTLNGYSFSANGTFSSTGTAIVKLKGAGTPANAEDDNFTVNAGLSSCGFTISVVPVVEVSANEHFPLTQNSFWNYNDLTSPGDTIHRTINGDTLINSKTYEIMFETENNNSVKYYFNKTGDDYFEYANADEYTNAVNFQTPVYGMLPFLKENLSAGDKWESPEFKGDAGLGQNIFVKYSYECTDNDATVIANGLGFKNVYIIMVMPFLEAEGNPYFPSGETYYYYYAKGVGLIYLKKTSGLFSQPMLIIRNWLVN